MPSIIYGMWGLFVFAPSVRRLRAAAAAIGVRAMPWILGPLFQGAPIGIGMLTAGIILAIMIIPFIASVMRDVFEVVPPVLKESAYALGCTTWEVVWKVVLPYTKIGVDRRHHAGPRPRARRDDGGDLRHRQLHTGFSASLFEPGNSIASALANEFAEAADPAAPRRR